MGSSDFPLAVVVSAVGPEEVSTGSSTDAPLSWYWGLPYTSAILFNTPVGK
ncbi:hypothetical protein HanPI659440_Chr04g0152261 [Helianthus annuus]|nr:hypothetical protein HanPI659440_Chr04g0152261 [Helianthus annuus]